MPPKKKQKEHYEKIFKDLDLSRADVRGQHYEHCRFVRCKFIEAQFGSCKFFDCEFKDCDLSLIKAVDCSFLNNSIADSKAIGINWAEIWVPRVSVSYPVEFIRCCIDYSSFLGLNLHNARIVECQARDCDFSEADLSESNLGYSDFANSIFNKTNLNQADLSYAVNYFIDVYRNQIKQTKFSLPEAINLLYSLDIELVEEKTEIDQ